MNPVSVAPASMFIDGLIRAGEIATFPDGSQWFTWQLTRGRSYSLQLNAS